MFQVSLKFCIFIIKREISGCYNKKTQKVVCNKHNFVNAGVLPDTKFYDRLNMYGPYF